MGVRTVSIVAAVCLAAWPAHAGEWSTSYGTMTLPDQAGDLRIFANYDTDEGRVIGRMVIENGQPVIRGVWVEANSGEACGTTADGSAHWGNVTLHFNPEYTAFTGRWDYCAEGGGGSWSGSIGASRFPMLTR